MQTENEVQEEGLNNDFGHKINNLSIYTSDGNVVDVRNLIIEINIFEYMFSPVMTGYMIMGEGVDLIANFRLHGNEFIEIEIDKPTLDFPIKKTFRIYKISDRNIGTSIQNYTIYFCSEEMLLSTQNYISRSYKGVKISSIILDILKNDLGVSDEKIGLFEETENLIDVIIPRMDPFQAINWLLLRAHGQNKSAFFFYENIDGFNLTSYENLLTFPVYSAYSKSVKVDNNDENNINGFTSLLIKEDFDNIKTTRYGGYSSSMLSLDLVSKSYDASFFNSIEFKNSGGLLNEEVPANAMENRLGKSLYDNPFSMIKYVLNNDSDTERNPIEYENWLLRTTARLSLMHSFKMTATVPGDPLLTAGNIIEVEVPKGTPQDENFEENEFRTSRYLITSVHHKFTPELFTTALELSTDSVNELMPTPLNNSDKLNELKRS